MSEDDRDPPQALVKHARFVRRVARSLVHDDATADDVSQDAWVAAAKHPPRRGSPRGWLATVVRNLVRKRARSDGRRTRRERTRARDGSAPATASEAERAETVRHVTDALMKLAPAQREVVMMRFYEDLPPREIASRLDISVNTVKSRLRLALGHMRVALDDQAGAEHRDWRAGVIVAFGLPTPQLSWLATSATAAGGITMTAKLSVAAAVAVVGLVVYGGVQWMHDEAPVASEPTRTATTIAGDTTKDPTPESAPELVGVPAGKGGASATQRAKASFVEALASSGKKPAAPSAATSKTPKITTPPTTLQGTLHLNGQPVTDAEGLLWRVERRYRSAGEIPAGQPPTHTAAFAADGSYRFDDLEDGSWMLGVKLDDGIQRLFYRARKTGDKPNEQQAMTLGTSVVFGFVYDEDGQPAANALVRVEQGNAGGFMAQLRTDAGGRYRVGHLVKGTTSVSIALRGDLDDGTQCDHRLVRLSTGQELEVSFGSPSGKVWVEGVVQCGDGVPVRGPGRSILSLDGQMGFVSVPYDEKGRFSMRMEAGMYKLRIWLPSGPGSPFGDQKELQDLSRDRRSAVWTLRGARVEGRVSMSDGSAIPEGTLVSIGDRHAGVHKDGTYVAYALKPGKYTALAWHAKAHGGAQVELAEGALVARVDVVMVPKDE